MQPRPLRSWLKWHPLTRAEGLPLSEGLGQIKKNGWEKHGNNRKNRVENAKDMDIDLKIFKMIENRWENRWETIKMVDRKSYEVL